MNLGPKRSVQQYKQRRTVEAAGGKLLVNLAVDGSGSLASGELGQHLVGLLGLVNGLLVDLGALLVADAQVVVLLVPLAEGGGINLHNGVLDQRLRSDKLVVGRVVHDCADASADVGSESWVLAFCI